MTHQENISMGSRELDERQIEIILPGYKNIFTQIYNMRKYAKQLRKENEEARKRNILEKGITINNVFSILGKRGAGKSSTLRSIRRRVLEENNELDIVLPTIFPETMDENVDMLAWVLGSFREIVDRLSCSDYERGNTECLYFRECKREDEKTFVKEAYKKVLKQYRYTTNDYADILKDNYSTLKEYIDKTQQILNPENELKKYFFEFVNKLIERKRELNKHNIEDEPMIFIFLDDLDLTKSYCQKLLNLVMRYLSNPNIIIFISGDYDIFEMELFLSYLRTGDLMKLLETNNNPIGEKLIMENKYLSKDALKKIIPPAYRYHLNSLLPKEKLGFYYKDSKNTLKKLLEDKFQNIDEEGKCLNVINAYGLIFDNMPRGIMNVYCALNNLDDKITLKLKNEDKDAIFNFKNFLNIIIQSSSILSKYKEQITNCIQIKYPLEVSIFNHERLINEIERSNEYLNESVEVENIINNDIVIALIFLRFIEEIIKLVNPAWTIHGRSQLISMLDKIDNRKGILQIYPHIKYSEEIYNLYECIFSDGVLKIINTIKTIYLKDFCIRFYFTEMEKIEIFNMNKINISDIYMQDPKWMQEKFRIIYYHRDPFFMMFNKSVKKIRNQLKNYSDEEYFNAIIRSFEDDFNIELPKKIEYKIESKIEGNDEKIVHGECSRVVKEKIDYYINEIKKILDDRMPYLQEVMKDKGFRISNYEEDGKYDMDLSECFSIINMNKGNLHEEKDEDINLIKNILFVSILNNTLKQLEKMILKKELVLYETEYFIYFEEWNFKSLWKMVYKEWVEDREKSSSELIDLLNLFKQETIRTTANSEDNKQLNSMF